MSQLLFLNLPVRDLQASRNFFGGLGFRFDGKCRDEHAACLIVNAQAFVTLIQREHFAEFVTARRVGAAAPVDELAFARRRAEL